MITQPQNLKDPQNPRYKTSLCKNFLTESGCQYGEKCQFAHGKDELRPIQSIPQQPAVPQMKNPFTQLQKNMMNFKKSLTDLWNTSMHSLLKKKNNF